MLTHSQLKGLKPETKRYEVTVMAGVILRVYPSGVKTWIINKSIKGKRITKVLGNFPDISIADVKKALESLVLDSYEGIKLEDLYTDWIQFKRKTIKNYGDIEKRFNRYILPVFGKRLFTDITPPELVAHLRKELESQNKLETIKRICLWFKQLEVFAANEGKIDSLRFQGINKVFPVPKAEHLKSIHPNQLTEFFAHIQAVAFKSLNTWFAVQVAFYTLLRPSEYCNLEWSMIDFKNRLITVPGPLMKMKEEHTVPISDPLYNLLINRPKINSYVLCSTDKIDSPMSRETIARFFKRQGITYLQPHGIRSIGRTWMAENGIENDIAELCLAHKIGSRVSRAYLRSTLLEERRIAMTRWSQFVLECIEQARNQYNPKS